MDSFIMATLYQLHSTMDNLRRSTDQLALTWRHCDSRMLLGSTAAFSDRLTAYLKENEITGIANIYALSADLSQLDEATTTKLKLNNKVDAVLSDTEWVKLTQDSTFDNVVTIAL
ncbi:MAG: hypothetical protein ACR2PP_06275 [Psychrobacter sp.]